MTKLNYLGIWRHFNQFLMRLDVVPEKWEDRVVLFCTHLVEQGRQSSMIKSYISAIKNVLRNDDDDYEWNDNILLLNTITKACKVINDQYRERLPIKRHLLEVILFELGVIFSMQLYLLITYRTLFVLAYYGLFRIGELSKGDHPIKAYDVHVAVNKLKFLIYLRLSKTHGLESPPQKIKICAETKLNMLHFCPFDLTRQYIRV